MLNFIATQVVYLMVFLAVLLGIEAAYYLVRSMDWKKRSIERRMQEGSSGNATSAAEAVSLMRERRNNYGPVSNLVVSLFPTLGSYLSQSNSSTTPAVILLIGVLLSAVVFVVLQLYLPLPTFVALLLALLCTLGIGALFINIQVSARQRAFAEELPAMVDLVARGLKAGHPVPVAMEIAAREIPGPMGEEFSAAIEKINFGLDRDIALRDIATRYPDPNFAFFVAAVEMQRETGGNLAVVLTNLSKVVRERDNMRKKAFALSAEGRLTAFIVGALPWGLFLAISFINPGFYSDVWDDPYFFPIIGTAGVLWATGILWIWKMVNLKV